MGHDFFYLLNFSKVRVPFSRLALSEWKFVENGGAQFQFWATLDGNFDWTEYTSEDQKWPEIHNVLFTGTVDSKNTRFLE